MGRLELDDDRYVRFAAVPLPDGNALCTFDDITDTERVDMALRDRTEALQAADEGKKPFCREHVLRASNAAHRHRGFRRDAGDGAGRQFVRTAAGLCRTRS